MVDIGSPIRYQSAWVVHKNTQFAIAGLIPCS